MKTVEIYTDAGLVGGTAGVVVRTEKGDVALFWPWPQQLEDGGPFWVRLVPSDGVAERWLEPYLVNVVSSPLAVPHSSHLGLVTFGASDDDQSSPYITGVDIPKFSTNFQRRDISRTLPEALRNFGGSWTNLLTSRDNTGVLAALQMNTFQPTTASTLPSNPPPGPAPTPAFAEIRTSYWTHGSILCHLILKID